MVKQTANTVVMVRPRNVESNEQTIASNFYQKKLDLLPEVVNLKAQNEFDNLVLLLRDYGILVLVVDAKEFPKTPDAHFPNNWISFHQNGDVAIYPMLAENRRVERREELLDIVEANHFKIRNVIDYSSGEHEGIFLEGTGSMVLDRVHKKAYCALSPRSNEELFIEYCEDFEYTPVLFVAGQTVDNKRLPIYHTNVMMSVAENFAVICTDAIDDKKERKNVIKHLKDDGKEIIPISEKQVGLFAGNLIEVENNNNQKFVVMSQTAFESLQKNQIDTIEKYATIISTAMETIEACGGGSVRCMMAEVFLPKMTVN